MLLIDSKNLISIKQYGTQNSFYDDNLSSKCLLLVHLHSTFTVHVLTTNKKSETIRKQKKKKEILKDMFAIIMSVPCIQ